MAGMQARPPALPMHAVGDSARVSGVLDVRAVAKREGQMWPSREPASLAWGQNACARTAAPGRLQAVLCGGARLPGHPVARACRDRAAECVLLSCARQRRPEP